MSIVANLRSSCSHSSCSGVGTSGLSSSGGMQFSSGLGDGRSCMSVSSVGSSRAPSVYGGAGEYCTRISQSSFSMDGPGQINIVANEKHTMQNLNDCLATYLEKVRSLETANSKLELQIKEFYEMRSLTHKKDLSGVYATVTDIRNKIHARSVENSQLILRVDNARVAADDFKMKFETEVNMRMKMEGDVARLRGVLDSFTLTRGDLEMQIEGLKEKLVYLRKNHEEEMHLMRTQQCGAVNVEMDCASSVDMSKVLEEMRTQYEGVVAKNQRDAARWFESKVDVLQSQIPTSTIEVKTSQVTDLKRTFHSLLTQKGYLEESAADINGRHGSQLSQLQVHINSMEEELQQLNVSIQQQASEYQILLDIKMRLEMEIAEYRRLLDGEGLSKHVETRQEVRKVIMDEKDQEVQVQKVVEEYNPHIKKCMRVIVKEKVVSTIVDEKVQEMNGLRGRDSSRIC
ncbi:keratin, type I cytoskeletal 47 kDa-like [Salmo trutta]|uniref:Keratin 99 n=1 Tax=Salmo trutta TaxID=8032 RepID=A0A673ZIV4_SALTR|nr:keratin, type I cytoskeletal 47 kDa-like [Salmo trutta]XP_029595583.1 keratin, type I cytoskeletal 47 kDa-like [Salmo trutta]